ncbi:MAG: hypothetical protein E6J92_02740 [Methanobacteriota archaeon]|nr:MAG: hypothetical protein E6J92_02740 [Euryarchaeota archaeon]
MTEHELGRNALNVLPTELLVERCKESLDDVSPSADVGRIVKLNGVLVVDWNLQRPCKLYLDIDGIGRFVIVQQGEKFVGVAFLPGVSSQNPWEFERSLREE